MPERGEGQLYEVIAGAGAFQQRAEQHEQEDHRRRHAERHAEHALGLHPEMPARLVERRPLPPHRVGEEVEMPEHHVEDEDRRHHQQRQAERPVDRDHHAQHAGDREKQVVAVRKAGAVGDVELEDEEIKAGGDAGQHERQRDKPVKGRMDRPGGGIDGEGQPDSESKVDLTGFLGVEDKLQPADAAQPERKIGRHPELEKRPDDADQRNATAGPLCAPLEIRRNPVCGIGRPRCCHVTSPPEAFR